MALRSSETQDQRANHQTWKIVVAQQSTELILFIMNLVVRSPDIKHHCDEGREEQWKERCAPEWQEASHEVLERRTAIPGDRGDLALRVLGADRSVEVCCKTLAKHTADNREREANYSRLRSEQEGMKA